MKKLLSLVILVFFSSFTFSTLAETRTFIYHQDTESITPITNTLSTVEVPDETPNYIVIKAIQSPDEVIKVGNVCSKKFILNVAHTEQTCRWEESYMFDSNTNSVVSKGPGIRGPEITPDTMFSLLLVSMIFFTIAFGIVLSIKQNPSLVSSTLHHQALVTCYALSLVMIALPTLLAIFSTHEEHAKYIAMAAMATMIPFFATLITKKIWSKTKFYILYVTALMFYFTFIMTLVYW